MSIATELQNLNDNILDAYTAVQGKGGTVPANKNMANLPTAINSVPSGGGLGIPREVSSFGQYRPVMDPQTVFSFPSNASTIEQYSFAYAFWRAINGPTGVDGSYLTSVKEGALFGAFGYCYELMTADFSSLTSAGTSSFEQTFHSSGLTTADFSSLKTAGGAAFRLAFAGTSVTSVDFSLLETVDGYTFSNAFSSCDSLTSISMPKLTAASDYSFELAFDDCDNLASMDFSALERITGASSCRYMFRGCPALSSVDLSSLEEINGSNACQYMFQNCTSLTGISLNALQTIDGTSSACDSMFLGCTALVSVTFSALSALTGGLACRYMFRNCTSLTSLSFPALTASSFGTRSNQFDNMLSGVTGCTVHFPASIQSTIGSWSSVTSGFGGTNTTVLFDL